MFAVIIEVLVIVTFLYAENNIKPTPVSPENPEQPQTVSKSSSSTGSGTKGMVKMISAHFEALNKQPEVQPVTEER